MAQTMGYVQKEVVTGVWAESMVTRWISSKRQAYEVEQLPAEYVHHHHAIVISLTLNVVKQKCGRRP